MALKYPHLFSPLKLGNVTLKNRIISAPISLPELDHQCHITPEGIAFYENRAKGGVAALHMGDCIVEAAGQSHTKQILMDDPLTVPGLAHTARALKRHGCVPSVELSHGGKYAGMPNLARANTASDKAWGPIQEVMSDGTVVYEMPEEMILNLAKAFGNAAARAKEAGFEMVMVHGGHGWLLNQFISPTNTRNDQYGGPLLENRMRFPILALKAIREAVGPGFPIEFRMSAAEMFEGGYDQAEGIEIAKMVQDYVDMIHVSVANHEYIELFVRQHPSMFLPLGVNVEFAAEIKKHVRIPVATVGAINDPDLAEDIIATGKADVVEIARGLIAEPYMPKKALLGQTDQIVKCIRCYCCMQTLVSTRDLLCVLNPTIGQELECEHLSLLPTTPKKVLVAGGGPGGMKAAMTAADRGHQVILCEATGQLGGQILCEKHVSFKKDYYDLAAWFARELAARPNIEVRLNTTVTPALVEEIAPDALIAALGADPLVLPIPGIDSPKVRYTTDLQKDDPGIGQKVVIIGGGLVGSETAVHLMQEGKEVSVVEMAGDYAVDATVFHKTALSLEFKKGIDLHLNTKAKAITDEGVVCEGPDGKEFVLAADTVFSAAGMVARSEQVEELRSLVPLFFPVGDCVKPGKVLGAIHQGYFSALDI